MASKINCLPVYVLIDTSGSMQGVQSQLNESIRFLYDEMASRPRISEFVYLSIISFNTEAEVIMRMTDLLSMTALPEVHCGGVTFFDEAFDLLRRSIDSDVPELSAHRDVLRPVVFVLTDGVATDQQGHESDSWRTHFDALVDKQWRRRPHVIPFGYGMASEQMVKELSTLGVGFMARDRETSHALQEIFPALLHTLVATATDGELRVPVELDGVIRVSSEVIE